MTITDDLKKHQLDASFFNINAVKNLQNATNMGNLQEDSAGSMEIHCNHSIYIIA